MNTLFTEAKCFFCWDSGIQVTGSDPPVIKECTVCCASESATGSRVFGAVSVRLLTGKKIDLAMLAMARTLVPASVDKPVPGETLINIIGATGDQPQRFVKLTARRLRNEWRLPVCGNREKPYGYFIASTPAEFLDWMRTTRNQAISELATAYHLFKANFPELAGQQSLAFVETVSSELQEAIR